MNSSADTRFWYILEQLLATHKLVIDRPKGQPHPRYPDLIYPLDYGYLEGTSASDGDGIDVWIGTQPERTLTGIACTFDIGKADAEVKLLIGCTPEDIETVTHFGNFMRYLFIPKGL
jgi:inorganic pyrophosphatase